MEGDKVTYFAETDYRNKRTRFGIKAIDRSRHIYVIGKTGMGKSTLLENMAIQDIRNGEGIAFLDPHGSSADLLLDYIPKERIDDVLYFAPFDSDYPISFNILEDVGYDKRHLVVSGLMSVFEKIWVDAWSARMAYILQNTLLALLEYPDATLLGVNRMYIDKDFRKKVVDNVTDPTVKSFWVDEFAAYTDRFAKEATPAIQNKIGQFISNPLIRNIIAQPKSSFDPRKLMDEKKIMIMNLSKGQIGEGNANLLGSMLVTKIYLGALSRADVAPTSLGNLPYFNLYVDEFQSFANQSFADILSEARKYKLNLHIAHQYIEQMPEEVAAAVFGNVGTMITFRIGGADAEVFEKEFAPKFYAEDMVNLGKFQMYLKLMVDGVASAPFSARTFPPLEKPDVSYRDAVIEHSRKNYAHPREKVEQEIKEWHAPEKNKEKKLQQNNRRNDTKRTRVSEIELRKAMSFDYLKKKSNKKSKKGKTKRGPSQENVQELRKVLQQALGSGALSQGEENKQVKKRQPENENQKNKKENISHQKNIKKDDNDYVDINNSKESEKEVPKHILKKLLELESEDMKQE